MTPVLQSKIESELCDWLVELVTSVYVSFTEHGFSSGVYWGIGSVDFSQMILVFSHCHWIIGDYTLPQTKHRFLKVAFLLGKSVYQ